MDLSKLTREELIEVIADMYDIIRWDNYSLKEEIAKHLIEVGQACYDYAVKNIWNKR